MDLKIDICHFSRVQYCWPEGVNGTGTMLILVTDAVWGEWSEWGSVTNPAVVEPEQELELVRARILEVADQIVGVSLESGTCNEDPCLAPGNIAP